MLFEAGAAILGIAFLVKAGMWPLCFWLPGAYMAAAAPVAAIFAVLSKVGVYILLRLTLLLFGGGAGELSGFGSALLLWGGLATIAFGTIGILASQAMGRLAGLQPPGVVGDAAGCRRPWPTRRSFRRRAFLPGQLHAQHCRAVPADRARRAGAGAGRERSRRDHGSLRTRRWKTTEEEELGVAMPGALALLGVCFGCSALLLAGLPPLSGFVAKFALLTAAFNPAGLDGPPRIEWPAWVFAALLILSGLAVLIAMLRTGIRTFWAPLEVHRAACAGGGGGADRVADRPLPCA